MGFVKNLIASLNLQNLSFSKNLSQNDTKAVVIVVLVFFIILVLAKMSRSYMEWYMSNWMIFLILGFILAIFVEGLFLVGGKTIFTEILKIKRAPRPVQRVIDSGRNRLFEVVCSEDQK
jgi:hypothetical protein